MSLERHAQKRPPPSGGQTDRSPASISEADMTLSLLREWWKGARAPNIEAWQSGHPAHQRRLMQQAAHLHGNRFVQRLLQPGASHVIQCENERAPLRSADLADLMMLFVADPEQEELCLSSGEVYTMDWLLGHEGTAVLQGQIQARLNTLLSQPEMEESLQAQIEQLNGFSDRRDELSEMVRRAFERAESLGLERASASTPFVTAEGTQRRTWTSRGEARDPSRSLEGRIHAAMDVLADIGTGVFAPLAGEVIFSGRSAGYGFVVRLLHRSPPPTEAAGSGPVSTNFAHLSQTLVDVGDQVSAGEAIGLVGAERAGPRGPQDVGGVAGAIPPHLHWSVQKVPRSGEVGGFSSRYEERTDLRVHPEQWLNELGSAVTGDDDRALRRYEERRSQQASTSSAVQRAPLLLPLASKASPALQRDIPSTQLTEYGNAEQTQFKRRVYDQQRQQAARLRSFVGDLPADQLSTVEGSVRLRIPAAEACRSLLTDARAALEEEKQSGDRTARQAASIGVLSGYRSAGTQLREWNENFERYYEETEEARAALSGGSHGNAAVRYLARYIAGRLAVPGYSLHNNGMAVDFKTRQGTQELRASTSQINAWRRSWFFRWLSAHASEYQFAQNPSINEPWHWEYQGSAEAESEAESE